MAFTVLFSLHWYHRLPFCDRCNMHRRFFTSVGTWMWIQIGRERELCLTISTGEGLFTSVGTHMPLEVWQLRELCLTIGTREGLFTRVGTQMWLEIGRERDLCLTISTGEWQWCSACLSPAGQNAWHGVCSGRCCLVACWEPETQQKPLLLPQVAGAWDHSSCAAFTCWCLLQHAAPHRLPGRPGVVQLPYTLR